MRDPRVDPRPGDVVRMNDGSTLEVHSAGTHVRYLLKAKDFDDPRNGFACGIYSTVYERMDHWRRVCADATVVKVAE